jgi:hypothetical protein
MAGLAGAARVIRDAHWSSHAMAGVAVGTAWVNLAMLAA